MALGSGIRGGPSDTAIFCVRHAVRLRVKNEVGCGGEGSGLVLGVE